MDANQVVACLFRAHLGLSSNDDNDTNGSTNDASSCTRVTSFRDLFRVPALASHAQKIQLLSSAERTGCADVMMDVLLFLSQTMANDAFHAALSKAPLCQQHWIQYELSQQQQQQQKQQQFNPAATDEAMRNAVEARVSSTLAMLLATKTSAHGIAIVLLELVFNGECSGSLADTQNIAKEVVRVVTRIKPYKLPQWTIDFLYEFIEICHFQLETERRDSYRAPPVALLTGYFDKRARGASNVNANWRMRFFQLDGTAISYSKHDIDTLTNSKNPFLDKRVKGTVLLTKEMQAEPLNYSGKVSRRPFCIKISRGGQERDDYADALIVDACTPVVQAQWLEAIQGNIRLLALEPHWRFVPRPCVVSGMTLHAFLRYLSFYHGTGTATKGEDDRQSSSSESSVQKLAAKIPIHNKRLFFVTLCTLAKHGQWHEFETLAKSTSKHKLASFFSSSSSSNDSAAANTIGYGAMLDVALKFYAPLGLVATLELLYHKHDRISTTSSSSSTSTVWTCHTKSSMATTTVQY